MKVDCSAKLALAPDACACVKCDCRICVAGAERGSELGSPITTLTKSAIAAGACVLDHRVTPDTGALASITSGAMASQMFSVPARKKRVGVLGSTGAVAPRP